MPRDCSVCQHPDRVALDAGLVEGRSYRDVARQFGVSKDAVARHHRAHVSPALVRVVERQEVKRAERGPAAALERLEDLYRRAVRVLERAEAAGQTAQVLGAVREARGLVEVIAKITGELREQPAVAVNVLAAPEIVQLTTVLMRALAPFPEARVVAADALAAIDREVPA